MKILIATDAWKPQINGVVRCLESTIAELEKKGHEVLVVSPLNFRSFAYPLYKEVRFSILPKRKMKKILRDFSPDRVHISTEGPIGLAARSLCKKQGLEFTSAYHTHFPQYLKQHLGIPEFVTWKYMKWFHSSSLKVLASSETTAQMLKAHGISKSVAWTRGIDRTVFFPRENSEFENMERPILLHVGRVSQEKNIDAFLKLNVPGTKVVVGDGPQRKQLEEKFPNAVFLGWRFGESLARAYSGADVLVFPSRSDTFGMVMIESLACGTPIAAFPVCGPVDIVENGVNGEMNEDLSIAISHALSVSRERCLESSQKWSWENAAEMLINKPV